jgi:hypothetical protein
LGKKISEDLLIAEKLTSILKQGRGQLYIVGGAIALRIWTQYIFRIIL